MLILFFDGLPLIIYLSILFSFVSLPDFSFVAKELAVVSVDAVCLVGAVAHEVVNSMITITQTNGIEVFTRAFFICLKINNALMMFSLFRFIIFKSYINNNENNNSGNF